LRRSRKLPCAVSIHSASRELLLPSPTGPRRTTPHSPSTRRGGAFIASALHVDAKADDAAADFAGDGSPVDVESHILDSCNFTGRDPLTLLFFPFSIRYHALHHLFPSMPYHHLKQAHEHLTATLPAESPYLSLDQAGWWSVARRTLGGTPQPTRGA
jgi:hypothetical protein